MDRQIFVKNIKSYCALRCVKPTVACRESGVGVSFINDIERGQTPSVAKVQMLSSYLGITVSELIGEELPRPPYEPEQPYLVSRYNRLSKAAQQEVMAFIEFKAMQEVEPVEGSISMEELGDTRPAGAKELEEYRKAGKQES